MSLRRTESIGPEFNRAPSTKPTAKATITAASVMTLRRRDFTLGHPALHPQADAVPVGGQPVDDHGVGMRDPQGCDDREQHRQYQQRDRTPEMWLRYSVATALASTSFADLQTRQEGGRIALGAGAVEELLDAGGGPTVTISEAP